MSLSLLASRMMRCCPSARAAACTSLRSASVSGASGLTSTAIVVALGTSSRSSSSRFAPSSAGEKAHAGDVAARPVEAGDEAAADRVAADREDDRNRCGCGLGRQRRSVPLRDDHGHLPANQFGRQRRQPIELTLRPAVFDRDVLALDDSRLPSGPGGTRPRGAQIASSDVLRRNPITGIAGCCARAASGHAAAAPPSSVMNSRRLIRSPRRRRRLELAER